MPRLTTPGLDIQRRWKYEYSLAARGWEHRRLCNDQPVRRHKRTSRDDLRGKAFHRWQERLRDGRVPRDGHEVPVAGGGTSWAPTGSATMQTAWVALYGSHRRTSEATPTTWRAWGPILAPVLVAALLVVSTEMSFRLLAPDWLEGRTLMEAALSWIGWPASTWLDSAGEWAGSVLASSSTTWVLGMAVALLLLVSIVANRWSMEMEFEVQVNPPLLGRALMLVSNAEHDLLWSNAIKGTSQDRVLEASARVREARRFGPVITSMKALLSGVFIAVGCLPAAGIVTDGVSAVRAQGPLSLLLLLWGVTIWWALEATISFLRSHMLTTT